MHLPPALCSLLAVALTLPAFSQQAAVPPSSPAANTIQLNVVVTPKNGGPVAELRREDFQLLDNKSPATITSFRALGGNDAPVKVILLIDGLNIGFQTVAFEQQQIAGFLRANEGRLAHPTTLAVLTDSGVKMQQSFSTDGNALASDLNGNEVGLRTLKRSTGFYGAAERFQISLNGLRLLIQQGSRTPGRKLILWVSPGWAFFSGPNVVLDPKQQQGLFSEIIGLSTEMRQANITLYSIDPRGSANLNVRDFYYQEFLKGVSKPRDIQPGDLSLQTLAAQSGGLVLHANNDLGALLRTCLADTDAYYEITFHPVSSERATDFHAVEVKVDRAGLTARTRNGYYPQP